jgi:hypothetical protein
LARLIQSVCANFRPSIFIFGVLPNISTASDKNNFKTHIRISNVAAMTGSATTQKKASECCCTPVNRSKFWPK